MAKRYLEVSDELKLPAAETATQTIVVYGGKGMGKTNFGSVLAEELSDAGQRFSVIDPIGVWHGLQYSADGKGPGLEVLMLGGIHGDIPIEPTAGAVVADLVADEEADVVIDISRRADGRMWSLGERIRFIADYTSRLYERQGERRRPLMQIVDEAGRFVPQMIPHGAPEIARCVGAVERMVEEGRNVGIGVCLITQRSARMNKSVSELAECMIAFRTVGPRSIDAILDWFGEHVEKTRWKELLEQLRSLPRGQALVVSPGWLGFEGVIEVRRRRTFDSSATPTAAEERRLRQAARKPDLEKYRERMAATIERAEAEDPRRLQAKVRQLAVEKERLERDLLNLREQPRPPTTVVKEKPALTAKDREHLERLGRAIGAGTAAFTNAAMAALDKLEALTLKHRDAILEAVQKAEVPRLLTVLLAAATPPARTFPEPNPTTRAVGRMKERPAAISEGNTKLLAADGTLKKHVRAMLTALAQHPAGRTRAQTLILARYQPSGDTSTAFAEMFERGWLAEDGSRIGITRAGLAALGPFHPLPTGAELRAHLLNSGGRLSKVERELLRVFFDAYPEDLTRAEVLERAGYKASGDTSTAVAKFRKLEWLKETADRRLSAAETFFE